MLFYSIASLIINFEGGYMKTIIYLAIEVLLKVINSVSKHFTTYEVQSKKSKRTISLINVVLMVFLSGIQLVLVVNLQ